MLLELTFCHKSSTNISINNWYYNRFIQLRRPIFLWNRTASLCFYNPDQIWDRACACPNVTVARHRSLNLRPESDNRYPQLDAFTVPSSHYVSNNLIYVRSHLFAGTDSIAIDLMTMEDWLFSQHMPPTILLFLLHYNLFSHLDVMEPYLWNI